jgi:hypothetical protein
VKAEESFSELSVLFVLLRVISWIPLMLRNNDPLNHTEETSEQVLFGA